MEQTTFEAVLSLNGKTATGIEVPGEVIEGLGGGKRPALVVEFNGYRYHTTVGVMGGRYLIPVSAEHRSAAGVAAGDVLAVSVSLDDSPRQVEIPADLADALKRNVSARQVFDALSNSGKKRHILSITGAKTDETRKRRLDKAIAELEEAADT
jgi:hypothetical protein